jgi:ribosomal protein S18 acetylase RimI-like enzyme
MQIHRLTTEDAVAYRALRLRALREHPEAFRSSYEEEQGKSADWTARRLGNGEGFFLGAFSEAAALVGAIGLQLERRHKVRHQGKVFGMYVASEFARRGVGQALIEALVAQARASGYLESLLLTVTSTNAHAVQLYRSAGFVECGREPRALKLDDRYYDKTLMFLDLRAE